MREIYAAVVHKVRKGLVRSTVLNQIKDIRQCINLLAQAGNIKSKEIKEYKEDVLKEKTLKRQVEIIEEGVGHLKQAIQALNRYKKLTTSV